jgi:uncharacterized protein YjbI with pentapeptide repeats
VTDEEPMDHAMDLHHTSSRIDANDANLAGSVFVNVNLAQAQFRDVKLTGATITDACMAEIKITDANLSGMTIDDCRLDGMTINGISVTELLAAFSAIRGAT